MSEKKQAQGDSSTREEKIEAAKEVARKQGKRKPQEGDTPESERPQTQKLIVDGTDG